MVARGSAALTVAHTCLTRSPWAARPSSSKSRQDHVEFRCGRTARHLVDMDEALSYTCRLRGAGGLRQELDDLGGQMERVDQFVLGGSCVDGDALDLDRRLVGRESFVDDLAHRAPVKRIGDIRAQILRQRRIDAAADLFVRRKTDPERSVPDLRIGQQMRGDGHGNGDPGLVVGAEQGLAAGRDDILAFLAGQRRITLRIQHLVGIVGQGDRGPVPVAVDQRRHAAPAIRRCRIDVGEQGDRGRTGAVRGCRYRGQHRAVAGQTARRARPWPGVRPPAG